MLASRVRQARFPILGGALSGLLTPAGLVTVAIGAVVGIVGKAISKTLDLGRNLGALRETTGETAENIQIYRRAIEETNGEASAFDAAVVRLTRSIGDAKRGSKETADVFENLGLRSLGPREAVPSRGPEGSHRAHQ